MINKEIFKAYDVRGIYPSEINEETVYLTAKAYAEWLKPKKVALGRDVRVSGPALFEEAKKGLQEMGVDVVDIGVVTTDMLTFSVANYGLDGGISITASHNPGEYNGMKMIREKAEPISIESGLAEIRNIVICHSEQSKESLDPSPILADSRMTKIGREEKLDITSDYIEKVLSFVDAKKIKPMKVVVNPNFGAGGKIVEKVAQKLGIEIVKLNFEEDGTFPKGAPNPLLEENRRETSKTIRLEGANLGVAWDADADRCFFFDENGEFLDGSYTVALLAKIILGRYSGGKVIHNVGLVWATVDTVKNAGGVSLVNKTGHSFIKERMKKEDAVFGGEISGHYYFKDFWFCDNGIIPFLLMLEKLSVSGKKLSELADPLREKYPISGEINFKVSDPKAKIAEIEGKYSNGAVDYTDGLSVEYSDWRFNVRASNTEPLLRLNLEAKTKELVEEKVREISKIIEG